MRLLEGELASKTRYVRVCKNDFCKIRVWVKMCEGTVRIKSARMCERVSV